MNKYFFAELTLDKKCYRLYEVVDTSLNEARAQIPIGIGIAYVAMSPCKANNPSKKSRLFKDSNKWENFLDKFFLTKKDIDKKLTESLFS